MISICTGPQRLGACVYGRQSYLQQRREGISQSVAVKQGIITLEKKTGIFITDFGAFFAEDQDASSARIYGSRRS